MSKAAAPKKGSSPAYLRQKEQARERQAQLSASGRDIGKLPKVENPSRKRRCRTNLRRYCETYHAPEFSLAWSPDHLRVIAKMEAAILKGGTFAVAMPRGSGKTTLARCACEWALLYGHQEFVVFVGSDAQAAVRMLDSLKASLQTNDLLAADFPEVCIPIRRLDGIHNRAKGQTCLGQRTNIGWTAEELILPTIKGGRASEGLVRVAGITGGIRGMQYTRSDGRTVRPGLVVPDDPQTDESAKSPAQSAARENILAGAILGLAGPGRKIAAVMPCTVIAPGDMADNILNRSLHPEWNGERTRMVYEWPTNTNLWERYTEIYRECLQASGHFEDATDFYRRNRTAMDAGSKVAWAERFNADELSALQNAWNLRLRDRKSFYAEYQNEPLSDQDTSDDPIRLTRLGLVARSERSPYGISESQRIEDGDSLHLTEDPPEPIEFATAGVDVQRGGSRLPGRLYWTVVGETASANTYPLGWGSVAVCPVGQQPSVHDMRAGLDRLRALFQQHRLPVVRTAVDVGDGEWQDHLVAWTKQHKDWLPIKGIATQPRQAQPGDCLGWCYPRDQKAGWKLYEIPTRNAMAAVHGALQIPLETPGALILPAGLQIDDALITHLCGTIQIRDAKRGLRWSEKAKDRALHKEWQLRIDYFQCIAYARAIAAWWRNTQKRAANRKTVRASEWFGNQKRARR